MHKKMDWTVFAFIILSITAFLTIPTNVIVHIPLAFADSNSSSDSGSNKSSSDSSTPDSSDKPSSHSNSIDNS
ncbi:MAG: hypothetical protein WBE68_23445 [Candidatus Nitrosopolaris sp.]